MSDFKDMLGRELKVGDKVMHIVMSGRSSFSGIKRIVIGFTPKMVIVAPGNSWAPTERLKGVPHNMIKMDDNEPGWPVL